MVDMMISNLLSEYSEVVIVPRLSDGEIEWRRVRGCLIDKMCYGENKKRVWKEEEN